MSDNNIDKLMKSMLENAQEEVPAHVWDGVSSGLDKAAWRIWWKRASVGIAAAAAIFCAVVFGGKSSNTNLELPITGESELNIIAVVQDEEPAADTHVTPPENILIAEVVIPDTPRPAYRPSSIIEAYEAVSAEPALEEDVPETPANRAISKITETKAAEPVALHDDMDWGEDDEGTKKSVRTSLVLSGITGTNSIQNDATANIMKRPAQISGPVTTGITETSTTSTYGIPVSAGIGVRIDFTDRWALGAGVNYSRLSRTFHGTYTKAENGTEISLTTSDIKNTQHYIGIPVNAYYNILNNKHINLYTYAGGTVEKCVADKYDVLGTDIIHSQETSGVQFSANLGIGVEFMFGKHLGLYADPSLRYYFNNNQPKSIRTVQPLMLGLELGLRIRL